MAEMLRRTSHSRRSCALGLCSWSRASIGPRNAKNEAGELDRYFDAIKERTQNESIRHAVLRVKRTRNPDVVFLERLKHFLRESESGGVTVLLAGVRPDFAQGLNNVRFGDWFPRERVFYEEKEVYWPPSRRSATPTNCLEKIPGNQAASLRRWAMKTNRSTILFRRLGIEFSSATRHTTALYASTSDPTCIVFGIRDPTDDPGGQPARRHQSCPWLSGFRPAGRTAGGSRKDHARAVSSIRRHLGCATFPAGPGA